MLNNEWIEKAKQFGRLSDSDSPEIIKSCYEIFGEDLGAPPSKDLGTYCNIYNPATKQLFLFGENL